MSKEKMIEIMMCDHCTKKEAEKHISEGSRVYEMSEKDGFVSDCLAALMDQEEAEAAWGALDVVKCGGIAYKVDYVL